MEVDNTALLMRRTVFWACLVAALLAAFPFITGSIVAARSGDWFAGFQHSFDDQMVYSAWMTQAQDGRLLMDNRFAVDPQPGLTVHLYYFVLGLISKVLGIPVTLVLARAALSALFIVLLHRFLRRIEVDTYFIKLALCLGVFGGGFGFLLWHQFGDLIVRPEFAAVSPLLGGRLPIDVWQPEAFVFPSLLTNGLFVVSLCLILTLFSCLIDAKDSWRPVPLGAASAFVLMNIHSYDVLLVTLVAVAFLAALLYQRKMTPAWAARGFAIMLGAVPAAGWFIYVLQNDAVFQARAATPTHSPTYVQVLAGILPLVLLAGVGVFKRALVDSRTSVRVGTLGWAAGLLGLLVMGAVSTPNELMPSAAWTALFLASVALSAVLARENLALTLLQCWSLVGLVAIQFPALFQRKLSIGLALPWAILTALALFEVLRTKEKSIRIAAGGIALAVLCLTSLFWIQRERDYIGDNVARTTVQPVFFQPEVRRILETLRSLDGRKVVLAMPGVALQNFDDQGPIPDSFQTPYIADLNPLAAGFGGAYAYAGHWSETPDYLRRRDEATRFFLRTTDPSFRTDLLLRVGATHLIAPVPEAFVDAEKLGIDLFDARGMGRALAGGTQYVLIDLRQPPEP